MEDKELGKHIEEGLEAIWLHDVPRMVITLLTLTGNVLWQ
jgi:hypothetical protein